MSQTEQRTSDDLWTRIEQGFTKHAEHLDPAHIAEVGPPLSAALADFMVTVGPFAADHQGGLSVLAALLRAYADEADAEARVTPN